MFLNIRFGIRVRGLHLVFVVLFVLLFHPIFVWHLEDLMFKTTVDKPETAF